MMRLLLTLFVGVFSLSLMAKNLLSNSDFNAKDFQQDIAVNMLNGELALSAITEDLSWNRCLKAEIRRVKTLEDGRQLFLADILFGKTDGKLGVPVEPDTLYNFSFDFKGDLQVSLVVAMDDRLQLTPKVKNPRLLRPDPRVARPAKDNWSSVKGSFKTAADAKFIRLHFRFWADSKTQKSMGLKVGDYVLIDNVKIEKKPLLSSMTTSAEIKSEPLKMAYLATAAVKRTLSPLPRPWNKNLPDIETDFSWQDKDDSIELKISFVPPVKSKAVPVMENGKNIWKDDVAEIFFYPVNANGEAAQFACSISGGRYHMVGEKVLNDFERWQARGSRENGRYTYIFEIPYTMLGFKSKPQPGEHIRFNTGLCYNRNFYSMVPSKTGFRVYNDFAWMFLGSIRDYQKIAAEKLLADAPEKLHGKIKAFSAQKFDNIALAMQKADLLSRESVSLKMGSAPFVAAVLPVIGNYSAPLEIGVENIVKSTIKLQAANNEIAVLPFAVINRTGKTASYRVVVHNAPQDTFHFETPTLDNDFPAGNITLREAVQLKDSESTNPGLMFDALPRMNEANVITVAPGESGLVWMEFDANKVIPGKYKGSIRVIPLSEKAEHTLKMYSGAMQDYPLELEVLPITLPAARQSWLCSYSIQSDCLKYMLQLGGSRVFITPFYYKFKFDSKGRLIDDNNSTGKAVDAFRKGLQMFAENDALHVKPKFMIGYGFYGAFKRAAMPKNMKVLTPEWENCWLNHCKAVRESILKSGLTMDQVVFEIWDEPKGEIAQELLQATKLARQAMPDAVLCMTWAAQKFKFTADLMEPFDELLNEQIFHWLLRDDPAYMPQINKIRQKKNVTTAIYQCSTVLREDLHTYFRLHPWRVEHGKFDMLGFYNFSAANWGQVGASDWKRVPYGAISYHSNNNCIPSIRFMAMRRGVDDIRYLHALKAYADKPQVAAFLAKAPEEVLKSAYNQALPDKMRSKAIELLIKYQKK